GLFYLCICFCRRWAPSPLPLHCPQGNPSPAPSPSPPPTSRNPNDGARHRPPPHHLRPRGRSRRIRAEGRRRPTGGDLPPDEQEEGRTGGEGRRIDLRRHGREHAPVEVQLHRSGAELGRSRRGGVLRERLESGAEQPPVQGRAHTEHLRRAEGRVPSQAVRHRGSLRRGEDSAAGGGAVRRRPLRPQHRGAGSRGPVPDGVHQRRPVQAGVLDRRRVVERRRPPAAEPVRGRRVVLFFSLVRPNAREEGQPLPRLHQGRRHPHLHRRVLLPLEGAQRPGDPDAQSLRQARAASQLVPHGLLRRRRRVVVEGAHGTGEVVRSEQAGPRGGDHVDQGAGGAVGGRRGTGVGEGDVGRGEGEGGDGGGDVGLEGAEGRGAEEGRGVRGDGGDVEGRGMMLRTIGARFGERARRKTINLPRRSCRGIGSLRVQHVQQNVQWIEGSWGLPRNASGFGI
ncbi:hypothetical protein ACHAWF_016844, partial [Thalassiosira exigua]